MTRTRYIAAQGNFKSKNTTEYICIEWLNVLLSHKLNMLMLLFQAYLMVCRIVSIVSSILIGSVQQHTLNCSKSKGLSIDLYTFSKALLCLGKSLSVYHFSIAF